MIDQPHADGDARVRPLNARWTRATVRVWPIVLTGVRQLSQMRDKMFHRI